MEKKKKKLTFFDSFHVVLVIFSKCSFKLIGMDNILRLSLSKKAFPISAKPKQFFDNAMSRGGCENIVSMLQMYFDLHSKCFFCVYLLLYSVCVCLSMCMCVCVCLMVI